MMRQNPFIFFDYRNIAGKNMTLTSEFKKQGNALASNEDAIVTFKVDGQELCMGATIYAAYIHELHFGDQEEAAEILAPYLAPSCHAS